MQELVLAATKLIVATCLCLTITSITYAGSITRLENGQIVIKAFGERLAFREKDAERIDFGEGVKPRKMDDEPRHTRTCDFCHCDLWNRCYHCLECERVHFPSLPSFHPIPLFVSFH